MKKSLVVVDLDLNNPADVRVLLHEATVFGYVRGIPDFPDLEVLAVGRARPFIPLGEDAAAVNRECARRFVVWFDLKSEPHVDEIDPATVIPFVDRVALLEAADVRANAAQRTNVKPDGVS